MTGTADGSAPSWERVDDLLQRRVTEGSAMTVTRYRFQPGGRFPLHRHNQEQFVYVVSGGVVFTVEGTPYHLAQGEMLMISTSHVHEAVAGREGAEVVSVVAPARLNADAIEILE